MRILRAVSQHMVKHIWEQYAKEYLAKHPDCYGKYYNKIHNYYIFSHGTKKTSIPVKWANSTRNYSYSSMAGLVVSYDIFRKVIETWIKKAIHAIVFGELVHINSIGKFCMVRVERDFRKVNQLKIDWGKTRKQEKIWNNDSQAMQHKRILFTDDDWCRVRWYKPGITNDAVYEFAPTKPDTGGKKGGFIGEVTRQLKVNPQLKFLYLFNPIRDSEDYPKREIRNYQK